MAELVSGAVVGAVIAELMNELIEAKTLILEFNKYFHRLKTTLEAILPRVQEVKLLGENLNDNLKHNMHNLLLLLNEGKKLVRKSSKLAKWKFWKKYTYSKRILELDQNLRMYAGLELQVDIWVDVKLLLKQMMDMEEKMSGLSLENSQGHGTTSLSAGIVPKLPNLVVGLRVPLEEFKAIIFHDSASVIGVCAPGGCGKTTFISKLCMEADVKARFKKIIFLTISNSPNIVETLRRLWAQLVNPIHVPEFVNVDDAVKQLTENLKKREKEPVLLILDDVWEDSILEKLVFRKANIVTVVTSRINLKNLDHIYPLKMLAKDDATTLFRHYSLSQDQTTELPDDVLLEQIVEKCNGYPLAIEVIGSSLKQQPPRAWRNTLQMLKDGNRIYDVHKDLLDRLSISLDTLDEELRECFIDLGAFPEDQKVPAAALMDMWAEQYNMSEDEAYVALLELSNRNLIRLLERTSTEAGDLDGTFNDLYVIQHDLLRDLAIHFSQGSKMTENARLVMNQREDSLPKTWKQLSIHASQAKLVSIHTGEMGQSSWFDMILPEIEVLILNFSASTYCLPTFLKNMENLKVLIINNHSSKPALLTGTVPWRSLKNLKRVRLEKVSLPTQLTLEGPLLGVEKLAVVSCTVNHTDSCSKFPIPTMFPILKELEINYCNSLETIPEEVCDVPSLQSLSVTNCPDFSQLPSGIGKARNLQVLRLQACTAMDQLPESIVSLENLKLLDMSHCSNIEMLPDGFGELSKLKKIDMRRCLGLSYLPSSVKEMRSLREVVCDEDTARLWKPFQHALTELEFKMPREKVDLDWLA